MTAKKKWTVVVFLPSVGPRDGKSVHYFFPGYYVWTLFIKASRYALRAL